ncbi:MAG: hypothetical protein N2645_11760 [Clostridia bacterium]|nr:hypothetical protein [Clostridia bacterium]
MLKKDDLKIGSFYVVDGVGNDIFKPGEKVLFHSKEAASYVFKQGSVEMMVNDTNIEKFLTAMSFRLAGS